MEAVLRGLKPESLKKCCHCKNEYYKKNKDKLFPRVDCDCGKTIYKYNLEKHLYTKYHTQIV
jgi:hypothetical protein